MGNAVKLFLAQKFLGLMFLSVIATVSISGCVTQTTVETKIVDQAGKTDALYRSQIHTERASEYYRLGRMPVALEAAKEAVAALPTHAPAYNMLGIVYTELRQDDKAREAYEQALRYAPNDSETLNNYGWFLCQRDNQKQAMQYFETALQNPVYATPERALYNMGVCARKQGDNVMAEQQLRATLRRQPRFAPAMYELADMQFAQGKFKDAEAMIARHNDITQTPGVDALWLGVRIARVQNDKQAEASYVQQLRRRFPDATQTRMALEGR
jgi:type IV pilus assembly protein PilF